MLPVLTCVVTVKHPLSSVGATVCVCGGGGGQCISLCFLSGLCFPGLLKDGEGFQLLPCVFFCVGCASKFILSLSPGQDPSAAGAPGLAVQILEMANSQELGADSVWPEGRGPLGPDS